jgi:geranylgeranyl reductase family protein
MAAHGTRVAVLERFSLPRPKVCGGGLVRRSVANLPELPEAVLEHQCRRLELHFARSNLSFATRRHRPVVSMVMRDRFDDWLLARARNRGVEVIDACEVTGFSLSSSSVRLSTTREPIAANFAVAADGAVGRFPKMVGFNDDRRMIPALEAEVSLSSNEMDRFAETARFDLEVTEPGYAWVFPKRNHLSIGLLSMAAGTSGLKEKLSDYLSMLKLQKAEEITTSGFVIPVSPRSGPRVKDRVILAGDALGLADPLTAEGISASILSGRLAGKAVIQGGFDPPKVRSWYHNALQAELMNDLRWSRRLAGLIYTGPRLRRWIFRTYGTSICEKMTGVITGETSLRAQMTCLRNYGKLVFRGPKPQFIHRSKAS